MKFNLVCARCGKPFTREAHPSDIKEHKYFFCSKECRYKWLPAQRWRKWKKKRGTCIVCGKEVVRPPSSFHSSRVFCSRSCKAKWFSTKRWENYKKKVFRCMWCGKEFTSPPSHPRKVCSRKCYANYLKEVIWKDPEYRGKREKKVTIECRNCGKVLQIWPSSKRKFCSKSCYNQYLSKLWKIHGARFVYRILGGRHPNSFERKVMWLCKKYSLPFAYVGNGQITIGGFNPDFIESNGRKLLIEVYCKFWHPPDYEEKRRATFKKYGFDVMFLSDEDLLNKDWEVRCYNKISSWLEEHGEGKE